MTNEIKVGIAFLVGLFLLGGAVFWIGDVSLLKTEGPSYQVYFSQIAGLGIGDPVLYGGFEVGEVTAITVDTDRSLALVTYTIDQEKGSFVKIHEDSEHNIGADLFGRAALTITFGSPESRVIVSAEGGEPTQIPIGIKPTDMSQVLNAAGEVVDEAKGLPTEVKKLTISLNENQEKVLMEFLKILQENRPNIKSFLDDVADIAASLSNAEGTIGKLIKEDAIYEQADEVMRKANTLGTEANKLGRQLNETVRENRRNVKTVTDSLADASPDFERSIRSIRIILDENKDNVKKITDDIAEATPRINKSLYDINIITESIARGDGLFNSILMDTKLRDSVSTTVDKIGGMADEISTFAGGANKLQTFLGLDVRSNTLDRQSRANLYLRIAPSASKDYTIGGTFYINYPEPEAAADLDWREAKFEDMTFTVLLGWRFLGDRVALKVGALESMVGGVLEYSFLHRLGEAGKEESAIGSITSLRLEFRGMDEDYEAWETEVMMRALIRHTFSNGLMLQIGGENLLNETPRFLAGFVFEYKDEDIKYVAGTL